MQYAAVWSWVWCMPRECVGAGAGAQSVDSHCLCPPAPLAWGCRARNTLGLLFFLLMFLSFRALFVALFTFPVSSERGRAGRHLRHCQRWS